MKDEDRDVARARAQGDDHGAEGRRRQAALSPRRQHLHAEEPPGVRGRPGAVHQVHVLLAEGDLIHDVPGDRRLRRPRRMGRARAARPRAGGRHLRPRGQRSPAAAGADRRRAGRRCARIDGDVTDLAALERRDGRARRHRRDPSRGAAGPVRARRPGARLAGERDGDGQRARGGTAARRRHGPGGLRVLDRGDERPTPSTRARSTASSSSPTRAPRPATSPTSGCRPSACARTRSTGPAATRG